MQVQPYLMFEGRTEEALRYGLSWQVNADALGEMLADKDAKKAKRVLEAMMQMRKIDIRKLKEAYDG